MNTTYQVTCTLCGPQEITDLRGRYLGCTGRTIHVRALEHKKAANKMNTKNAMGKHYKNHHHDVAEKTTNPIAVKIIATHKSVLDRLVDESLRLEKEPLLANSRGEWGRGGGLIRLTAHSTQADGNILAQMGTDNNFLPRNRTGEETTNQVENSNNIQTQIRTDYILSHSWTGEETTIAMSRIEMDDSDKDLNGLANTEPPDPGLDGEPRRLDRRKTTRTIY